VLSISNSSQPYDKDAIKTNDITDYGGCFKQGPGKVTFEDDSKIM